MAKNLKLTFLGTGTSQGVPVIGCRCDVCRSTDPRDSRLRTSAMVEVGEHKFVIDAGPDFRVQMLRENVSHISDTSPGEKNLSMNSMLVRRKPTFFMPSCIAS